MHQTHKSPLYWLAMILLAFQTQAKQYLQRQLSGSDLLLKMNDSFGDGWEGAVLYIYDHSGNDYFQTTLASGLSYGEETISSVPDGCYTVSLSGGSFPSEISWSIEYVSNGDSITTGGAPLDGYAFMVPGCFQAINLQTCTCSPCTYFGENCSSCNGSTCLTCDGDSTYIDDKGYCQSCTEYGLCKTCNQTTCTECINENQSVDGDGNCACPEANQIVIQETLTCETCEYYHEKCLTCDSNKCLSCDTDYIPGKLDGCYIPCSDYCLTCDTPNTCTKCMEDFKLVSGVCEFCGPNCFPQPSSSSSSSSSQEKEQKKTEKNSDELSAGAIVVIVVASVFITGILSFSIIYYIKTIKQIKGLKVNPEKQVAIETDMPNNQAIQSQQNLKTTDQIPNSSITLKNQIPTQK